MPKNTVQKNEERGPEETAPTPLHKEVMHPNDTSTAVDGPALTAAFDYQAEGKVPVPACSDPCTVPWHETPCPGKRPLVKIKDRDSVTAAEVRRWWRRWPDASVAILTGARSDLVVIDIDGEDGEQALKRAEAVLGQLPPTLEVKTKRGRHLYFAHPGPETRILTRKGDAFYPEGRDQDNAHGLDVRGDGGLVIAPPSPNRVYANDLDPVELPDGWIGPLSTGTAAGVQLQDKEMAQALDLIRTEGEPCDCMERVLDKHPEEGKNRHEALIGAQHALVMLGREQHPGAGQALDRLQELAGADDSEWTRALEGAVSIAMDSEPAATGCPYVIKDHLGEQGDDNGPSLDQLLEGYAAAQQAKEKKAAGPSPRTQAILEAALDATDLDSLPKPEPLLPGWLNRAEYVLVSGKFGTYKSLVLLAWAYCVATGQGWAGRDPAEPAPVVYVAAEGITGFRRRKEALERRYGVKVPEGMLTVIRRAVHLTNRDEMVGLATVVGMREAQLVILDTWHRMTPGVDENSATETGGPIDQMLTLRDHYGATVVVAHHTGHAQRHARGSSALEDDADASWMIRLGDGTEDEEGRGPSTPRTLIQRKSKDGEVADPALLRLQVDDAGQATVDLDTVQPAPPVPGRKGRIPQRTHADMVQELITLMDEHGIPLTEGYRSVMDWDAARRPGHAATQKAVREAVSARRGRKVVLGKAREALAELGVDPDQEEHKPIQPSHPCPKCGGMTVVGPDGLRGCVAPGRCQWQERAS
jgi:AAA domain-containing protein/bifunctional DNA primase/polymerase-like protein